LVPANDANATSDNGSKGARCYIPKAYCEFTGGEWIKVHGPVLKDDDSDDAPVKRGYCFYGYDDTYCAASLDGLSFVTATLTLKYAKDESGYFYTDPLEFATADIVPAIPNPDGSDVPFFEGQNLGGDGQAFLDRGCKEAPVPETPASQGTANPATDYCPNLDGVQWENYDCATGGAPQAVAAAEAVAPVTAPEPATVPESVTVPEETTAVEPATVAVPEAATVPVAVPAGGGSSAPADGLPTWAAVLIFVGTLGAAVSGLRLAGSLLR
jgi:hypothetical protein